MHKKEQTVKKKSDEEKKRGVVTAEKIQYNRVW